MYIVNTKRLYTQCVPKQESTVLSTENKVTDVVCPRCLASLKDILVSWKKKLSA